MSYRDWLKNKRWIIKRNKIFKRDKWTCTSCGSKDNIQVHHTFYYEDQPPPWDYPDDSLLTICERCHHKYHETHELTILPRPKKKKHKKKQHKNDIPYPKKKMSLAQKVEFRKKWLYKKNKPYANI